VGRLHLRLGQKTWGW